jgi:predicted transcriptional regulator
MEEDDGLEQLTEEWLTQYNNELDQAEAQIDNGDFLTQEEVKKFFADKRNNKNLPN